MEILTICSSIKKEYTCTQSLPNDISPNDFNTFFTSIFERLSSHFDKDKLPKMPPTVLDKESTFNFAAIEPNFILKCLQNLPDKKGLMF